jgi:hypothetical protein
MNVVKVNKSRSNGMTLVVPSSVVKALQVVPDYMNCEAVDGAVIFRPLTIAVAIPKGK